MERQVDDLSFEGAWKNQSKRNKKSMPAEQKKSKPTKPAFRGQRDIVDTRTEIRMATKQQPAQKRKVNVVAEALPNRVMTSMLNGKQTTLEYPIESDL